MNKKQSDAIILTGRISSELAAKLINVLKEYPTIIQTMALEAILQSTQMHVMRQISIIRDQQEAMENADYIR